MGVENARKPEIAAEFGDPERGYVAGISDPGAPVPKGNERAETPPVNGKAIDS